MALTAGEQEAIHVSFPLFLLRRDVTIRSAQASRWPRGAIIFGEFRSSFTCRQACPYSAARWTRRNKTYGRCLNFSAIAGPSVHTQCGGACVVVLAVLVSLLKQWRESSGARCFRRTHMKQSTCDSTNWGTQGSVYTTGDYHQRSKIHPFSNRISVIRFFVFFSSSSSYYYYLRLLGPLTRTLFNRLCCSIMITISHRI